MKSSQFDVIIIGAGMSGLTAALALSNAGRKLCVLDKGRGPGGRMAARRAEIAGETVSFDHGAQFFTARDPAFQAVVADWEAKGVVARWPAAGDEAFVGTPRMNAPIRHMADELAVNAEVRWGVRVLSLERTSQGWQVKTGEETFTAPQVLIAVPAEQAAELLGGPAPDLAAIPARVRSEACWSAMVAFSEPLDIRGDALRFSSASISWAARNSAKPGRAGKECWVLHADPERSAMLIDMPKDAAAILLLADFYTQTGIRAKEPIHVAGHRWLYAKPKALEGDPARFDAQLGLGIAGDYLHSPRVEGAFLSGKALAQQVLAAG